MNPPADPLSVAGERLPGAVAIYVVDPSHGGDAHVSLALSRLRALVDKLIVVVCDDEAAGLADQTAPDHMCGFSGSARTPLAGLRDALAAFRDEILASGGPVIFTSSAVFGPTGNPGPRIAAMAAEGIDLYAPYWHAPALVPQSAAKRNKSRIPFLDFAVFAPRLLVNDGFWKFWATFRSGSDHGSEFLAGPAAFSAWMRTEGLKIGYAMDESRLETADPQLAEVHKLVEDRAPCIPVAVFTLDPLLHDLNAINLRDALDRLRTADPELYTAVVAFASRYLPLRDFTMVADQYEVLPHTAGNPQKSEWAFGPVAVFIHVFYRAMIEEFWELTRRLPCAHHLFLTTSGESEKAEIEAFLRDRGLTDSDFTVRTVEQNRGRDMSSLFITWRDVVADNGYQVALRLHSKRTPQVSRQVGESFKEHLFDNLIASSGYVANLLDMMEAEPDIGLVIPPAVHIGFDTLGHSWFNNKAGLSALCREMGFEVPLDEFTPVAPYGTMYWFRTDALRKMFEWPWKWDAYNTEPHHIDGGLAHVQERLIGYAAQSRGYRVLTVMTPRLAARNYAKLEYKMQYLTGHLMTGHILTQAAQLKAAAGLRIRLFRALKERYGRLLVRHPGLRGPLRPAKQLVVALFTRQKF